VLLLVGELVRAPVRALLLLGQVDAEQLRAEVLQAVAVGVGARQLGGDLGAVHGLGDDAQVLRQHGDVEAAEVEDLEHGGIRQQGLQARRRPVLAIELHEVGRVVASGELHQAQPVAVRLQASVSVSMATEPEKASPAAGRSCAA